MFKELWGGTLQLCIPHPIRQEEILFLIFDFTHNFKNIFNNFLVKGRMHIPTSGFETILGSPCLGLFSHIKQLYHLEEHKTLKVAHTLKKVSLNPSNVAKTSPQHAISKCVVVLVCNGIPAFCTYLNKIFTVLGFRTFSLVHSINIKSSFFFCIFSLCIWETPFLCF